jgi:hypothetical protein
MRCMPRGTSAVTVAARKRDDMTTNAEKEMSSTLLDSCEIFHLRVSRSGVPRREAARESCIGQLCLDRSHIRHVTFERVKFADDRMRVGLQSATPTIDQADAAVGDRAAEAR